MEEVKEREEVKDEDSAAEKSCLDRKPASFGMGT
jgi:hypothetical protein